MWSTPEPEPLLSLGLSASAAAPRTLSLPDAETLQFQKAVTAEETTAASPECCIKCGQAIVGPYFWLNGEKTCSPCGVALQAEQKSIRLPSLFKSFLWGTGAALAGTVLYATITIVTGFQIAFISILIGYLVGKAIRRACHGRGGRPQQIMAVLLTYCSITFSYIPIAIHHQVVKDGAHHAVQPAGQSGALNESAVSPVHPQSSQPLPSLSGMFVTLITLVAVSMAVPFFGVFHFGGLLSLLIIFWGLQQAWRITAQPELLITGPYGDEH
jgi:hypothetical protein